MFVGEGGMEERKGESDSAMFNSSILDHYG